MTVTGEIIQESVRGGSEGGRVVRAVVVGALAAGLGTGIAYAVEAMTGSGCGWIALPVAILVAGAVRWGSRAQGGWFYQGLAILLLYASMVCAHIPYIADQVRTFGAASLEATSSPGEKEPPSWENLNPGQRLLVLTVTGGILFGLTITSPFLGNPSYLGLVSLLIGLFAAWKLNQRSWEAQDGPLEVAIHHQRK